MGNSSIYLLNGISSLDQKRKIVIYNRLDFINAVRPVKFINRWKIKDGRVDVILLHKESAENSKSVEK